MRSEDDPCPVPCPDLQPDRLAAAQEDDMTDMTHSSFDAATPATHDARALIPDGVKAEITLDGQSYTLRITRAGKLILTK